MTTIAFDGQIVAADTRVTLGPINIAGQRIRKILPVQIEDGTRRPLRFVYAFCGALSLFPVLVYWHASGADTSANPFNFDDGSSLIVIDATNWKRPKIAEYHTAGRGLPLNLHTPMAFGSGMELALGVMDLGYNALTAVEQSAKFDTATGPPIEAFDIKKWRWIHKARPTPANAADLIAAFKSGVKQALIASATPKTKVAKEAHKDTEAAVSQGRASKREAYRADRIPK